MEFKIISIVYNVLDQTSETKSREEVNRVGEQIENIQLDAQPDISERLQMESVFGQ